MRHLPVAAHRGGRAIRDPRVAVLHDIEVDQRLERGPCLRGGERVQQPLGLAPGHGGIFLGPELDDHPGLVVRDGESVGVGEDGLERCPPGARLERVPVVPVGADEVDVRVAGVVGVGVASRLGVERPAHHRPHERHVGDAASAEHRHDVTERRGEVVGSAVGREVVFGLVVEGEIHRVAERLDRVGVSDDRGVLAAVGDRGPGSARLPVDERDPSLAHRPCLGGVRERAVPLVVVVVDRELPSDLGLDAQDRIVLGLGAAWFDPGAEVRGGWGENRGRAARGSGRVAFRQQSGDECDDGDQTEERCGNPVLANGVHPSTGLVPEYHRMLVAE